MAQRWLSSMVRSCNTASLLRHALSIMAQLPALPFAHMWVVLSDAAASNRSQQKIHCSANLACLAQHAVSQKVPCPVAGATLALSKRGLTRSVWPSQATTQSACVPPWQSTFHRGAGRCASILGCSASTSTRMVACSPSAWLMGPLWRATSTSPLCQVPTVHPCCLCLLQRRRTAWVPQSTAGLLLWKLCGWSASEQNKLTLFWHGQAFPWMYIYDHDTSVNGEHAVHASD